jgi:hypothetical protein
MLSLFTHKTPTNVTPEHYISTLYRDLVHTAEMARCYVLIIREQLKNYYKILKLSQAPRNPQMAIPGLD